MCWSCVVEEGGDKIPVSTEMIEIAGLIWDWYRADTENSSGGALHVQLDDYNLDDYLLQDDWYSADYIQTYYSHYTPEVVALGTEIVRRLRALSPAQRNRTVSLANPYNDERCE